MKNILGTLSLFCLLAIAASAQDAKQNKDNSTSQTPAALAAMVCPVTGEEADPEVSYAYKGTTYYFCCQGCVSKFKKDPAKYIKASEKQEYDPCDHAGEAADGHHTGDAKATDGQKHVDAKAADASAATGETPAEAVINLDKDMAAQITNAICPVMNEPVDKSVTTVSYKGKVYGFCCKACIKKFAKDPEKYLKQT